MQSSDSGPELIGIQEKRPKFSQSFANSRLSTQEQNRPASIYVTKMKDRWSEDAVHLLSDSEVDSEPPHRDVSIGRSRLMTRFGWLNAAFFAVNVLLLVSFGFKPTFDAKSIDCTSDAMRRHELEPMLGAIEYKDSKFTDSGFHAQDKMPSIFEGPRTHAVDNAWMNLTTVGFVSLTKDQNEALANPSVESMTHPGTYPVAIGVFHQLHCLNYLRVQLFPLQADESHVSKRHDGPSAGQKETGKMKEQHKHHCLDYLRQVIQCHGDTTPLSVFYTEDKSNYAFDHAVTHSCRNFDKIYGWAVEHAANIHIEG